MDAKRLLRSRLLAARAARPHADITATEEALAAHGAAAWSALSRVAAFAAIGTEPPTHALLDRLRDAGVTVLLPVVSGTELLWSSYDGWDELVEGPLGLLEPAGPPASDDVLASVEVVLVPALAVDRDGNRLGRGKGYYDRAMSSIGPERAIAVVYDDEVLDDVPIETHDRTVGAVLTPSGLRRLGG